MAEDPAHRPLAETLVACSDRVAGYLYALGAQPAQVEEILQEVAVAAATCAEPPQAPLAWLLAVAQRRFVDHIRRAQAERRREQPLGELADAVAEAMAEPDAEVDASAAAEVAALRLCLGRLAPRARELIDLRYWRGLDPPAIAARVSWAEGAVRVGLSKAKKAIEECVRRTLRGREGGDA